MSLNSQRRPLPTRSGNRSIYETIREHEEAHNGVPAASDPEDGLDDVNIGEQFRDTDIEDALADAAESQTTTESTAFLPGGQGRGRLNERQRPRWATWSRGAPSVKDEEDDVPQSLLYEDRHQSSRSPEARRQRQRPRGYLPDPVPGPSSRNTRIQWDTAQAQQQLYSDEAGHTPRRDAAPAMTASGYHTASAYDKAMWRWANVENLDIFLTEVYDYYIHKGIWCITLARLLRLGQSAFIVGAGIFLTYCIDYSLIPSSKTLPEVIIPRCTLSMSFFPSMILWLGTLWWLYMAANMVTDLRRLRNLQDFYRHLLSITDDELQTISWQEIVGRLMALRDDNPRTALKVSPKARKFVGDNSKDRMDAIDIANRIMRRENYMIALFNKEVLDMTLPIPFLRDRQLYSRNLEWNIQQVILTHFFNDQGQVYQYFLKPHDRQRLIQALQERFLFFGCMNLIQAPFLIAYNLTVYFLRYFKEFQRDPSQLGSRSYTPMAEWKFREFNELYHFFRRRADMSHPFATRYLDQFPKDKTVQISSFIAFVSGALLALLALASLLDPSNFLNFELTPDRTVLFYLGLLTVIWSVCRGIVPEENQVYDPEFAIQHVIEYTHYCPSHWKERLHTDDVRREFSGLYQMRVLIFLEELASFITTPLVLWYSLPKCSERIVDFFREFTVHVDGLGYVCWFAQFEFDKAPHPLGAASTSAAPRAPPDDASAESGDDPLRRDYYASKDNKMLASYYNFIDNYGANPRKGPTGNGLSRGRFVPPPSYPGLGLQHQSPSLTTSTFSNRQAPLSTSQRAQPAKSSQMQRSQMEPSRSLLLDPHHQPPSQPSISCHSRKQGDDISPPDPMLEAEQDPEHASQNYLDDGESWKTTRAAAVEDIDDGGGRAVDQEEDGADAGGVLGLLYQFQRAQKGSEGKTIV